MRRTLAYFAAAIAFALTACAPQLQMGGNNAAPQTTEQAPLLWADFSDEGIVWSNGKQACVARAPQMQPVCPRLPAPTGPVAWDVQGRAWVALPRQGLVTTLDGPPQSQVVGRVAAMSAQAVYREDGSALSYSGEPRAGVAGRPSAVATGGDGNDYAVVGRQFMQVGGATISPTTSAGAGQGRYLYPTARAAALARVPTAVVGPDTYTLHVLGSTENTVGNTTTLWKNGVPTATPSLTSHTLSTIRTIGTISGALWSLSETTKGELIPLPLNSKMSETDRSIRN